MIMNSLELRNEGRGVFGSLRLPAIAHPGSRYVMVFGYYVTASGGKGHPGAGHVDEHLSRGFIKGQQCIDLCSFHCVVL